MKIKEKIFKLSVLFQIRWLLTTIAFLYLVGYFTLSATPGNSPYAHPLGWWGWFDQGEYLKESFALLQRDFSPNKYFYPPLYPFVGSVFLLWSSGHPFFIVNLVCLLWFAYVFIRVADRFIPRWCGVLLIFGTLVLNIPIFENYLIPWTTTLSVALLASGFIGLVWIEEILDNKTRKIKDWQVFFVAMCLGLIVLTRPADGVIGGILGFALLIGYVFTRQRATSQVPSPARFMLLGILGFAIGPALYLIFNNAIYGSYLGNYFQLATGNGFFLADLAEKFVSLWLDGEVLYGEPNAGLVQRYPWLVISLAGMIWALIKGNLLLRALAIATGALFVLYMPYGDLLPNGLWRYLNVHYFKWTFPFLGLFAWILVSDLISGWRKRKGWALPLSLLIFIPGLLLTLHLSVNSTFLEADSKTDQPIRFAIPDGEIDLVDIRGITGDFNQIYFGNHQVVVDGKSLQRVRDFRLLPVGSDVRLLFIRPIAGKVVELLPDPKLGRHDKQLAAYAGVYKFKLGAPNPFREKPISKKVSGLRVGDAIDFSTHGNSQFYSTEGWSGPEEWGRWSINKNAGLAMNISGYTDRPLILEMTYGALVGQAQTCQKIIIKANEQIIGNENICLETGGQIPALYRYELRPGLIQADRLLNIDIATPDSISPRQLGINADSRILGIALKTLRVTQ